MGFFDEIARVAAQAEQAIQHVQEAMKPFPESMGVSAAAIQHVQEAMKPFPESMGVSAAAIQQFQEAFHNRA